MSKNNAKMVQRKMADQKQKFGIRKLSFGVASVLLGTVFYMQGSTVHADVNPTMSVGNDTANVINENSGISSSAVTLSTSNSGSSANSASSVVSVSDVTNSIATSQASGFSIESATSQVSNSVSAVSEQGSAVSTSQVNAGVDNLIGSDNISVASSLASVQNSQVSASTENASNEQARSNSLLSLNQSSNVNPSFLVVSKVASTDTSNNVVNGGFDKATWGTLDVSKWTGQENNGVYELTGYTGDLEHIIVPNSADFAKAGRNVGQVGISADTTHSWFEKGGPESIAFSKTDGQMVKAVGSDWTSAFTGWYDRNGDIIYHGRTLTLFDGNNLDVSNVMDMLHMFAYDQISDLTSLSNWKTENVMNMADMFDNNQINDLTPLANWKTENVTNMEYMFESNQINDLTPLANWKTEAVTNMRYMFHDNQISDLKPLANWKTENVTNMDSMFESNQISNLMPLSNWKTENVTNMEYMFESNQINDLTPLANWKTEAVTNMDGMFYGNQISDLTPLANWKTENVTNMADMFSGNQISDLKPLANWKTENVTNMLEMFDNNQISDLTPLANWRTENVINMSSMFERNKISNLTPLANWKTDNVKSMSSMFSDNQISDLTPLANWNVSNVESMSSMFSDNQVMYADFTKWNFGKGPYLFNFIDQWTPVIIVVKNADQNLFSSYSVISTSQNQLHFGSDTVDMPTVYVASDKDDARQKILADINTKLSEYQKSHANDDIKPVEPLDHITELVDLANAKFISSKVPQTFRINFVDDANGNIVASSSIEQAFVDTTLTLDAKALTKLIPEHYYFTDADYSIPTSFNYEYAADNLTIHLTKAPVYTFNLVDDTLGKTASTLVWDGIDGNHHLTGTVSDLNQKIKQAVNSVEWKNVPAGAQHGDVSKSANLLTTVTDLTALPTQDTTQTVHFVHVTHLINDAHDVSQVIHYVYQNGSKALDDHVNSVHFSRDGYHDEFDNTDHWNSWTPSVTYDFAAVQSPKIQGFTPDIQTVDKVTVNLSSQNIEQTVTYNPDSQKAVVKYIDDTDQKQLSAEDLTGHSDEDSGYNTKSSIDKYLVGHYVLVSDDTHGQTVIYDHDDKVNQVYEVHFKHGTEPASESRTKNLIVHYAYADGLARSGQALADQKAQSVTFNRTGTKDLVTNNIAWNDWDHAGQTFDEITSPTIDGYTPDQTSIKDIQVNADSLALTEKTVVYNADSQKLMVNFIDDVTGKTLETVNKVGQSDESANYDTKSDISKYIAKHYDLFSDDTKGSNLVFDHDDNVDQVYNVHLIHHTHQINDQVTKSEVIHYVYADGLARTGQASDDYHAKDLVFTRDGYHDEVTNEDHWNAWKPAQQEFASVKSPEIQGYTADQTEIPVINMNSSSDNIKRMVTYNADKQKLDVVFIDDTLGKTLSTVTKEGLSDESASYNTKDDINHYKSLHYNVVSDGTQGQNLVFDHDDGKDQHYEVHLVHATHPIDEQKVTNQTIHYQLANGTKVFDDHIAQVDFSRDGYNDEVTNENHWNKWTPSDVQTFSKVVSLVKSGYTPDKAIVAAVDVHPGDKDIEETVIYSPDKQVMTINYIDDVTGKTLSTKQITGVSDASANYNTKSSINNYVADHYKLVSDDTNSDNLVFDHDDSTDQVYTVHLTHTYQKVDDHKSVNETVHYVYDNGQVARPDYKAPKIIFSRSGTKDLVTNNIVWNAWTPAEQSFDQVTTSAISGYTPDVEVVPSVNVSHGSDDVERTVIYHADDQTILVNYIDDDTHSTLKTDTVIGKTAQKSNYTTKKSIDGYIADHYKLVSDDTNDNKLVFDSDSTKAQVYNIHFKHVHQNVSDSALVNEIIHYIYADGSKASDDYHAPVISFKRTGDKDLVTNAIVWDVWNPARQDFKAVGSPVIDGYTPSQKTISNITVKPGDKDVAQTVIYAPDTQSIVVNYIDDVTGKTLKTDTLTGKSDRVSDYTTKNNINGYENQHYVLVSDDTQGKTLTFDHDDSATQVYNVHLSHQTEPASQSRIVHETINYVYADGSKAADTVIAKPLTFIQTGVKDLVTGNIDWNGTWTSKQTFAEVKSPEITGYTASRKVVDPITVDHNSSDIHQTVIYVANDQTANIKYIDDVTGKTLETDSANGKFGDRINFGHDVDMQIKSFEGQGYKFKSNSFNDQKYQADNSQNEFEVHFTHGTQNVSRTDKVTETVKYQFADGRQVQKDHVQTAEFTQHGVQDLVTKMIVWTPSDPQTFVSVDTPHITGYTADVQNVPAVKVNFGDADITKVVTYKANDQLAGIKYIDDTTGKTLDTEAASGKFGTKIEFMHDPFAMIQKFEGQGYKLVLDNFEDQKYQADNSKNQFEVHFTHGTQNVSRTDKVTETVKYQFVDGRQAQKDHVQMVEFTQHGVQDLVTKTIVWAPSDSQTFVSVDTPHITGYTADTDQIPAVPVNFGDDDITKVVTYKANDQTAKIKYVDDVTGKTLDTEAASGKFGTKIEFMHDPSSMIQKFEGQGYELVSDNFKSQDYQADNSKNQFEVHFKHGMKNVSRTSTITRTINYVDQNTGKEVHQPVIQTLIITENGMTDLVTGKTTWDTPSDQQFVKVESPKIDGYENPDILVVDAETAKFGDGDQTVTVHYQKVETPATSDTSKAPSNSSTPSAPSTQNESNISTMPMHTPTQVGSQNVNGQQISNNRGGSQLPQTGNQDSHQVGLVGLVSVIFAGLLGLGKRRKKND